MNNDLVKTPPQDEKSLASEQLEQELYAALRAAGASPEEAQDCLKADALASAH